MPITVQTLRRLEQWSAAASASGTRQAVLNNLITAQATSNTAGTDKLTVILPTGAPTAPPVGSVLRLDESDTVFDEWRVLESTKDTNTGQYTIGAAPWALEELGRAGICKQVYGDGRADVDFQVVGQTPAQIIANFILPVMGANFTVGTISSTIPLDFTFKADTPLSALKKLCAQGVPNMELDVQRNGTTGYTINLVNFINATAANPDVRAARNLQSWRQDYTRTDQVTRVVPTGAPIQGLDARGTMGRAAWLVTAVAGTVITLADPAGGDGPILADGQLVGKYIRNKNGTLYPVTASAAAGQTVTATGASGFVVNDLIQFRDDVLGNDMIAIDSPGDVIASGVIVGTLDLPDINAANNAVPNPYMRQWSSTLPTGWTVLGTPTITKNTNGVYTKLGGASIEVQALLEGDGILTPAAPAPQSAIAPYVSGFARVWVVFGSVRVEMLVQTPTGPQSFPVAPANVASNDGLGSFLDIGVSGIDFNAIGATSVQLRIIQNGPNAATFFVDASQVTNGQSQQDLVEGSGGTKMWQQSNIRLRTNGGPLVKYEMTLIDLARLSPATYAADTTLLVGATTRVTDSFYGMAIATRLLEIQRDYLQPGLTAVTLSNLPDDLSGTGARPKRGERLNGTPINQSAVSLIPPDYTAVATESSDGKTGTLTIKPRLDIQKRTSRVDFTIINGRGDVTTSSVSTPDGTGSYVTTVDLTQSTKTPSKVTWVAYGTDLNGVANQALDGDTVTFGVGSKPFVTDTGWSVSASDGTMTVTFGGDSDTDSAFILVREWTAGGAPSMSAADILSLGTRSLTGARKGAVTPIGPRSGGKLGPNTKFTIGVVVANINFNSADPNTYSDAATVVDSWAGIGATPSAVPYLQNFTAYADKILCELVFDQNSQDIEVYLDLMPTDPASTSPINSNAGPPPPSVENSAADVLEWYNRQEASLAADGVTYVIGLTLDMPKPGGYGIVTCVGYDAMRQRLNAQPFSAKLKAAASAPTSPGNPSCVMGTLTSDNIPVVITTPASGVPVSAHRPWLNGVQQADVPNTAGAGSNQTINIPATPTTVYNVEIQEVASGGYVSARVACSNNPQTTPGNTSGGGGGTGGNGKLEAPGIYSVSYSIPDQAFIIVATAPSSCPPSTVCHLKRSATFGGSYTEMPSSALPLPGGQSIGLMDHVNQSRIHDINMFYKVFLTAPGWTQSNDNLTTGTEGTAPMGSYS